MFFAWGSDDITTDNARFVLGVYGYSFDQIAQRIKRNGSVEMNIGGKPFDGWL